MFVLVAHFTEPTSDVGDFRRAGDAALARMAADPGCRRLRWARSTDEPGRWVLTAEFDTAADYRRMLSPFPARELLVPWLSLAEQAVSGISEVHLAADGGALTALDTTVTL